MKDIKKDISLFRRYLDDLYTTADARKLLDELHTSESRVLSTLMLLSLLIYIRLSVTVF